MYFGRERKTPVPVTPPAKTRPKMARMRPKITKMRPKMAKMRPGSPGQGPGKVVTPLGITGARGL